MGRRRSVQVFLFSSAVAFVGNGSIRTAIFIQRLDCLNVEKRVCNVKRNKAGQYDRLFALQTCRFIQCRHCLEDKRGGGEGGRGGGWGLFAHHEYGP